MNGRFDEEQSDDSVKAVYMIIKLLFLKANLL
jgi:hypothetical protein